MAMKSAPMVARYPVENWPEMYWVGRDNDDRQRVDDLGLTWPRRLVLPTPDAPMTTSLMVSMGQLRWRGIYIKRVVGEEEEEAEIEEKEKEVNQSRTLKKAHVIRHALTP